MRKYSEYHLDRAAVPDAETKVMAKKTKNTDYTSLEYKHHAPL